MNWGTKIIIAYICFGLIIFSMVAISMNQDVNLVAKDYYKQEIAYQDQMDRIDNYNSLESPISIVFHQAQQNLSLTFPNDIMSKLTSGTILLFRPSHANMDRKFEISLDDNGNQVLNLDEMTTGLWRVKLNWNISDKEYYHEKIIVI